MSDLVAKLRARASIDPQGVDQRLQAEAAAALEAAQKDAARYRQLRDVDPDAELPAVTLHVTDSWGNWRHRFLGGAELDAAIDAAIAERIGK